MGVPLYLLAVHSWRVLLVGGFPPSFPPLLAARIKCVLPFGGSPLLVGILGLAAH